jgi:hypothetical protein
MSERETILKNSRREFIASGLPKNTVGSIVKFWARKVNLISDAIHKWAQP